MPKTKILLIILFMGLNLFSAYSNFGLAHSGGHAGCFEDGCPPGHGPDECPWTDPACSSTPENGCDARASVTFSGGPFNLPLGIDVCRDSITIDCNDNKLIGSGGPNSRGIGTFFNNFITITNCNITGFHFGIWLVSSTDITANKNKIHDNFVGINLYGTIRNRVSKNVITNNDIGINLYREVNVSITENNVTNNFDYGIRGNVEGKTNISSNLIINNGAGGMALRFPADVIPYPSFSEINDNNISFNGLVGLFLANAVSSNISRNSVVKNNGLGLFFEWIQQNDILENYIEQNLQPGMVLISGSNNNLISLNNVSSNDGYGIVLSRAYSNRIRLNNVSSNKGIGIYLETSDYNNLTLNEVSYNLGDGVSLIGSSYNMINLSNVSNNTGIGINLASSNNNLITKSNVNNNSLDGIRLTGGSLGNNITKNRILFNLGNGIFFDLSNDNMALQNIVLANRKRGADLDLGYNDRLEFNIVCLSNEEDISTGDGNFGLNNSCGEVSDWRDEKKATDGCKFICGIEGNISIKLDPPTSPVMSRYGNAKRHLEAVNVSLEYRKKGATNTKVISNFTSESTHILDKKVLLNETGTYKIFVNDSDFYLDSESRIKVSLTDKGELAAPYAPFIAVVTPALNPIFIETDYFDVNISNLLQHIDFSNNPRVANTNAPVRAHLDDYAFSYYYLYQAVKLMRDILKVPRDMPSLTLPVFVDGGIPGDVAHFICAMGEMHIPVDDVPWDSEHRPVNMEWHEYGHYVHCESNMGGNNNIPRRNPGDGNHMGYLNSDSKDAVAEGFADFIGAVIANLSGDVNANIYLSTANLEVNQDIVSPYEEFTFASLLWDLYDGANIADNDNIGLPLTTIFNVLNNQRVITTNDSYRLFSDAALVPQADLDKIYIARRIYNDSNNNNIYDTGEPIGITNWTIRVGGITRSWIDRPRFVLWNGSYILVSAVDSLTGTMIRNVTFDITTSYYNVYPEHNYTDFLQAMPDKLGLYMSSFPSEARIVAKKKGYKDSTAFVINSTYYWKILEEDVPYVANHTFVLKPVLSPSKNFNITSQNKTKKCIGPRCS